MTENAFNDFSIEIGSILQLVRIRNAKAVRHFIIRDYIWAQSLNFHVIRYFLTICFTASIKARLFRSNTHTHTVIIIDDLNNNGHKKKITSINKMIIVISDVLMKCATNHWKSCATCIHLPNNSASVKIVCDSFCTS